jgi:uncharacterized phage-associated protein
MSQIHCGHVAKYFIDRELAATKCHTIPRVKIQKLVVYAQGLHIACYGPNLFDDPIESSTLLGPFVPNLYAYLDDFEDNLDLEEDLPEDAVLLIEKIYDFYGVMTTEEIMKTSHTDFKQLGLVPSGEIIPISVIANHFYQYLLAPFVLKLTAEVVWGRTKSMRRTIG